MGISNALLVNGTLETLTIGLNPLTISGVVQLLVNIYKSRVTKLRLVEIEGMVIHDKILQMVEEINQSRPLKLIYSHCVKFKSRFVELNEKNAFDILGEYISAHMLRVVDFFRIMDRNNNGYLTREQLINGLQKLEVPVSQAQLRAISVYVDPTRKNKITY
ncbi:hypothetical protein Ciccas_013021, partial [Cichlidogyrus casuarinus]